MQNTTNDEFLRIAWIEVMLEWLRRFMRSSRLAQSFANEVMSISQAAASDHCAQRLAAAIAAT
jgi:hypothetical protein